MSIGKIGARPLARVIPTATAEAGECCGGGCSYEYRCYNGYYQRR